MKEPQQQQTLLTDDEATLVVSGEETTRVAPRFDDEETLVARPVVPLAETPAAHAEAGAPAPFAAPAPRRAYALPRSWPLALMLASVLIGGVLGGAGLYFYQRQSRDAAPASEPARPETTAAEAPPQPAEAPATQSEPAPTPAPTQEPPAEAQAAEPAPDADTDDADDVAVTRREAETTPAAVRRDAPPVDARVVTPRRGKKGEREEETERRQPARDTGGPVAASGAPEARRVDTIFYRQRRADRQAERRAARRARRDAAADTDRVRRIFEGSPQ